MNLRGSWISDVEMIELARLPDLERLDLSHTRISDEGMLNLKPAPKISELKLFYSEWITDQGMTAIKEWKHLKRLDLRGTRISDGTLEIVGKLTGLEALDIAHTEVTDVGLENLITLVNLKELALGRGRLSNAGLVALRMLPTLTVLDLSGARPTPPDAPGGRGGGSGMPEETLKAIAGTERTARALPGVLDDQPRRPANAELARQSGETRTSGLQPDRRCRAGGIGQVEEPEVCRCAGDDSHGKGPGRIPKRPARHQDPQRGHSAACRPLPYSR